MNAVAVRSLSVVVNRDFGGMCVSCVTCVT